LRKLKKLRSVSTEPAAAHPHKLPGSGKVGFGDFCSSPAISRDSMFAAELLSYDASPAGQSTHDLKIPLYGTMVHF